MNRRSIVTVAVFACLVTSCTSGSKAQKQDPSPDQTPEVVALDRGLELAFADQPGVVMKFRLDQMEQVSPAV
ncbi:MAG: hypothetical protein ACQEVA_20410, partial [Myxococcota bacterium]